MSQYIVVKEEKKFVFGWDQALMSFFLQVHDLTRAEDEQIVAWLGADPATEIYEVEHLVQAAGQHGLMLDHARRMTLYADKDGGL